ncbi:SURF1 family protein [Roseivivax marinus]|uniref:SURF1 family protein n=1 Tax=Roseivivax marinus TaxID=1379903 RepID=UPI001F044DAB|nr:SURF1 family protein [Roseivivax marinus]UMA63812.1 SURF1 family protein [Roseivivax marinus]
MKRLIAPLLIGLVGAAILCALGIWQVQRLAWKEAILDDITSTISGPADTTLPSDPDPQADRYRPVQLDGTVDEGELHVLVSQKRVGAGYRVIAPFTTEAGRRVLIDRGFVPTEDKDLERPAGEATITANLHWPQETGSFTPETDRDRNIWFARDVAAMADALGTEPILAVVRLEEPPVPGVTPLPVSTEGIPNDHLQYAITWFSLAAVWIAMTGIWLRRGHFSKDVQP